MKFHIPIRIPSLANARLHWRALKRIKRQQRDATLYCLVGKSLPPMPCIVTITRVGQRRLDDDNLAGACKYVRDQIAEVIGVDDGSPLYTWRYEQRVGSRLVYGVDVEIVTRTEEVPRHECVD